MKKTLQSQTKSEPVLLKVSRSGSSRTHIEIPAEHREDFKPGDHVWVEKVVLPSRKNEKLFTISELIAGSDKILKAKIMKERFDLSKNEEVKRL